MHYQEISKDEHLSAGFMYWKDALLGEKHRGSRVRVVPHKSMLKECGYCKKVKVLGEEQDVYFDEFYIDFYYDKTGIDYKKLWDIESSISPQRENKFAIAQTVLYDFLREEDAVLNPKLVRHSMLIKFQSYLEANFND